MASPKLADWYDQVTWSHSLAICLIMALVGTFFASACALDDFLEVFAAVPPFPFDLRDLHRAIASPPAGSPKLIDPTPSATKADRRISTARTITRYASLLCLLCQEYVITLLLLYDTRNT